MIYVFVCMYYYKYKYDCDEICSLIDSFSL